MKMGCLHRIFWVRGNDSGTLPLNYGFESMKQFGILLAMLLLGHGLLRAQGCKAADAAWSNPGQTPTLLAIIVGNEDDLNPQMWHQLAVHIPAENTGPRALHFLRAHKTDDARAALAPPPTRALDR